MSQFSSADRKTIVIRIPRKYRSLIQAFVAWLRVHPNQAGLWNCEEKLSQALEQKKDKLEIAANYSSALRWLQQDRRAG